MPLLPGKSAIGHNISTEESAGKPHAQAIAIALDTVRSSGADVPEKPAAREVLRKMRTGK